MVLNIGNRICVLLMQFYFQSPLATSPSRIVGLIERCGTHTAGLTPIESETAGRKAKGKINGGDASA